MQPVILLAGLTVYKTSFPAACPASGGDRTLVQPEFYGTEKHPSSNINKLIISSRKT